MFGAYRGKDECLFIDERGDGNKKLKKVITFDHPLRYNGPRGSRYTKRPFPYLE